MATLNEQLKKEGAVLTFEEMAILMKVYDKDKNNKLSKDELDDIVKDYKAHKHQQHLAPEVERILRKFDTDGDGHLDTAELEVLLKEVSLHDGVVRYAAYTAACARMFRYLAFTSDFGEALRPVVHARIVTASYAIAIGYCFVDVAWEAHKLKKRNYKTEKGEHMPMMKLVVERSTFQALASVALPFAIIHTTVDSTKKLCRRVPRLNRFLKWGPSLVGLSIIPLLPVVCDEPVEHAVEWAFARYGPWAHIGKDGKEKQH